MKGFVQDGALRSKEIVKSSRCGACGLAKNNWCCTPKMAVQGKGKRKIMFVLPPVSKEEDQSGKFLHHKKGRWLRTLLQRQGVDTFEDCWFTSALICHSEKFDTKNLEYCQFMLERTIEEKKPTTIIPIGYEAIRSVIGMTSGLKVKQGDRWVGWRIPAQKRNVWVCPTHSWEGEKDESLIMRRMGWHIEAALEHEGRPWKDTNDWEKLVKPLDDREAIRFIKKLTQSEKPFAFDYETTCLKPEGPASDIASAAITIMGKLTVAFAWSSGVAVAMRTLLTNPAPKIAANCKFEDRWTRCKLGVPVRNWAWDTMQAAHCLDNRQGVTSVEFNAFVLLGFHNYAEDIKPYFRADHSYDANRIFEIPLPKLLLYNGLDTLLEWKIAERQIKMMNHPVRKKLKI